MMIEMWTGAMRSLKKEIKKDRKKMIEMIEMTNTTRMIESAESDTKRERIKNTHPPVNRDLPHQSLFLSHNQNHHPVQKSSRDIVQRIMTTWYCF